MPSCMAQEWIRRGWGKAEEGRSCLMRKDFACSLSLVSSIMKCVDKNAW